MIENSINDRKNGIYPPILSEKFRTFGKNQRFTNEKIYEKIEL